MGVQTTDETPPLSTLPHFEITSPGASAPMSSYEESQIPKILWDDVKYDVPSWLSESAGEEQELTWIPDPQDCYVPARVISRKKDGIKRKVREAGKRTITQVCDALEVSTGSGSTQTVAQADCLSLLSAESLSNVVPDLVRMDDINTATILHNMRVRFKYDKFQTDLGTILVLINPFKWITELYTDDVIEHYKSMRGSGLETPPHVYATAEAAYVGILGESEVCKGKRQLDINVYSHSKYRNHRKCIRPVGDH